MAVSPHMGVLTKHIEWTLRTLGNNFATLALSSIDVSFCSVTKLYSQIE